MSIIAASRRRDRDQLHASLSTFIHVNQFSPALERSHERWILPITSFHLLECVDLIVAWRNALNLITTRHIGERDLMIDAKLQTAFRNHYNSRRCDRLTASVEHAALDRTRIRSDSDDEFRLRLSGNTQR